MELSENKLKPCPFCGGEASDEYVVRDKMYRVTCPYCGISVGAAYPDVKGMPAFKTEEETIKIWNRRVADE